ncbi:DUF3079 domain-containing protein [Hydrogenophaga sp. MI9]|uniref:DUF3079 domain-containing protein n=1 Tax=Hydrogenophaga sp. MI9 TaxID=3453719 RepID=UPI003EEDF327
MPKPKRFPDNPPHPERNCWGCDRYCAASGMLCGNGSERTQHPAELFGPDWADWVAPVEPGAVLQDGAPPAADTAGPRTIGGCTSPSSPSRASTNSTR